MGLPRKRDRNAQMAARYVEGFSVREIATEFGVSFQCAHKVLKRDYPELLRAPNVGMNRSPAERIGARP